jgi:hypothetical protein
MTADTQPPWAQGGTTPRWTAGRLVALIIGILLLLPAIGLLLGGGVLLWADRTHRTGGYVMSGSESFTSSGFALTSERIHLSTGPGWVPLSAALGTARLHVTGVDPSRAIFVGIAPVDAVTGYLGGVRRTVVNDIGNAATAGSQVTIQGGAPAGPPTAQTFWTAQVSGPGRQQLSWAPAQGNWTLVVMNADGSAGVAVQARIGATAPGLTRLAWSLIGGGLLLTVIAVLLIVFAARRPAVPAGPAPVPTGPPPGGAPPGGPGGAWGPPAPRTRSEPAPDPSRSGPETPGQPPS